MRSSNTTYSHSQKFADLAEGCTGYKWLTDADRHHTFTAPQIKCDRNKITEKSWYRFANESGTQMLTTCIPILHCNTHAPGWLFSGKHPEMHEGVVLRRVCFHWSNNCCHFKTDIRVRSCGSFYAYELGPPPACQLRYCGEWEPPQLQVRRQVTSLCIPARVTSELSLVI